MVDRWEGTSIPMSLASNLLFAAFPSAVKQKKEKGIQNIRLITNVNSTGIAVVETKSILIV